MLLEHLFRVSIRFKSKNPGAGVLRLKDNGRQSAHQQLFSRPGFPGWFDFFDVVEKVLPRLAEVHLHDSKKMPDGVRGYGEDHKPLGHGDLDLGRFLDQLATANFNGPLVFELKTEEALESLKVVKSIRPAYLKEK